MRPTHTKNTSRLHSRFAAATVACLVLALARGPMALTPVATAASTFRPTLLVNTEAFLAIDDDDTTANVVLSFGDTLSKTLTFNRTTDRFEFNDDLYVGGSLTQSGVTMPEHRMVSSGDGNDTRITRTATDGTAVRYNTVSAPGEDAPYSIDFDGSNDYVDVPSWTVDAPYTISTWLKVDDPATVAVISWGQEVANKRRAMILWNGGSGPYRLYSSMYDNNVGGTSAISADTWYHVAITVDASHNVHFYLNGAADGSGTHSTPSSFTDQGLNIGRSESNEYFPGLLDDVRIYSRELSSGEIATLASGGDPDNTDIEGHWTFDEGSGTTATDSSGNGKTGTLTNDPAWSTDVPGAMGSAPTDVEVEVWKSQDGLLENEEGINTFGWEKGRTNMNYGTSLRVLLGANNTEVARWDATGKLGVGTTAPRTKLEVVGALSGSFLYATRSFSGAGLTDCDNSTNSKLLWDAATGRFSCGTDQSGSTSYTAGQGLSLAGTSFRLNAAVTGSTIHAVNRLSSSGSAILHGDNARLTVFDTSGNLQPLIVAKSTSSEASAVFQNMSTGEDLSNDGFSIGNYHGPAFLMNRENDPLSFGTNNLARMQIDQDGNVGVGLSTNHLAAHGVDAKLEVAGAMSGAFVYATRSFSGAGLTDCDTAGTSKLMWDASTGRFSCGTDQTGGTSGGTYTAGQGLSLSASSAFSLSQTISGTLLEFQTVSGSTVYGSKTVASSGSLVWEGTASGNHLHVMGNLGVGTASPDTKLDVIGTISGASLTVSGLSSMKGNVSLGDAATDNIMFFGDVNTSFNADSNNTYSIGNSTNRWSTGWFANINTSSDANVGGNLSVSGHSVLGGDATDSIAFIGDVNTSFNADSNNAYSIGNVTNRWNTGWFVNLNTSADANVGGNVSVSGNSILGGDASDSIAFIGDANTSFNPDSNNAYSIGNSSNRWQNGFFANMNASDNVTFGDAIGDMVNVYAGNWTFSTQPTFTLNGGPLLVKGTLSGATLYATRSFSGAGLTDCDTAGSSKLMWDATTGRFSCGTDQTGGSSGGLTQTQTDERYVKKAGDTMTGALRIAVTSGNTNTLSLRVGGVMSGANLVVTGSGRSPLVTTDTTKPALRIGGSGMLLLGTRGDPGTAPSNTTALFAQNIAGRATTMARDPSSTWAAGPLQASLFGNMIMSISTGAGTNVTGHGTDVLSDTTVSHPTADQTFGYMANFATAATSGDEAGTSSANVAFFRGSTTGANGFFYHARVGVVDTTSITVFSGMADQTIATMVGADNPSGNFAGFQFSSGRGDANWQFTTKDNSTQNVVNTGLAFTANKVYDVSFYCTKQCSSVTWEIRNVTDGTSATGVTSSNLPSTTAALRIVLGVESETTAAKNIRMQQIYVESDR